MFATLKTSSFKSSTSKSWIVKWLPLWVVILLSASSCSTFQPGVHMPEVNRSLVTLYQAIAYASPGGVLRRSKNNRVFYSHYHPPGGDFKRDARTRKKRAQSVITLMNSKRPYLITFEYRVEQRFNGKYEQISTSEKQANRVKKRLEDYLASRPDNTDMIDDFRAF